MPGSLPRSERILSRREFLAMKEAPAVASGRLVLAWRPNALGVRRLGVTVSSRVGGSVVRNRIKRWMREAFRAEREALPPGLDVVLVARPGLEKEGLAGLRRSFLALAAKVQEEGR